MIPANLGEAPFVVSFSTVSDGNMLRTNANREKVEANRRSFLQRHGANYEEAYRVRTSHGCNVELIKKLGSSLHIKRYLEEPRIDADFDFYHQGADGAVTLDKKQAIFLISGDCVPLILWDELSGLHGVIHIGLMGAVNNIVRSLRSLLLASEIPSETLCCYLGPSIKKANYNISDSGLWRVIRPKVEKWAPETFQFVEVIEGDEHFDLEGAIRHQLVQIGVMPRNIRTYPNCTASDESLFFSHYKTRGAVEREQFISLIGPKP